MTCHVLCVRSNIQRGKNIYIYVWHIRKGKKKKNITDQPADD